MCFSAEASFAVGAVLVPAGGYCITAAVRKDHRYLLLAMVPLVFGLHQLCEGVVWRALQEGNQSLAHSAGLLYLFVAVPLWPFYVPLCVLPLEPRKHVRHLLLTVAGLGLLLGMALYVPLVLHPDRWLKIEVAFHSIRYDISSLPGFQIVGRGWWRLVYVVLVSVPLMISPLREFRNFSIMLALSATIAYIVFWYAFISIWCFFAAVLSVQMVLLFRDLPAVHPGQTALSELDRYPSITHSA